MVVIQIPHYTEPIKSVSEMERSENNNSSANESKITKNEQEKMTSGTSKQKSHNKSTHCE